MEIFKRLNKDLMQEDIDLKVQMSLKADVIYHICKQCDPFDDVLTFDEVNGEPVLSFFKENTRLQYGEK